MIEWGNRGEWEDHSEIRSTNVLWTIFVILLLLWLVGVVSAYTLGGFIHILLVLALVVMLIRIIQGRTPAV
ncbi:MAG TPA: lmo0937 family membrane protein [Terriglobales bacterium]